MDNEQHEHSMFFRAMMTGLFVGIVDTVICLAFNIFYRDITGYVPSELINVSSLIFGVNLLLWAIGMLYYVFKLMTAGKGDLLFSMVVGLVTAFLAWRTELIQRFSDVRLDHEFRGLLLGVVLVCGVSAVCLPLLYNNRKFEEFAL
ncbi:MAG: hypothetical protein JST68_15190 [Bacteroidetes bacterium]|nr:hypothetical protein [Bacteroidota bacterium]